MNKILRIEEKHYANETKYARLDIAVSTESELVGLTMCNGIHMVDGSIAWCISTGAFYGLLDGEWYAQDGSGTVTDKLAALNAESLSAIQPLNIGKLGKATLEADDAEQDGEENGELEENDQIDGESGGEELADEPEGGEVDAELL